MIHTLKMLFFEKKSQLELWVSSLNISSLDVIRYASFFGISFLAGLLFKRWGKYIISISVIVVLILGMLASYSIIMINFPTIQKITGFSNITDLQSMCLVIINLIKQHTWELCCSVIGFILGFKTG